MLYSPDGEQQVNISNWIIFEFEITGYKTYHLCGEVNGDGRVCSPLQDVIEDEENYIFTSRSGKKYVADKKSKIDNDEDRGLSPISVYVLDRWVTFNGGWEFYEDTTVDKFMESKK